MSWRRPLGLAALAALLVACGSGASPDGPGAEEPGSAAPLIEIQFATESTLPESARDDSAEAASSEPSEAGPAVPPMPVPATAAGTLVAHARVPAIAAWVEPDGPLHSTFAHPTERGVPLVFEVLDASRPGWLEVRLPVRPNGSTAWVRADDVELFSNPYRIEVDTDAFELVVYEDGEPVITTAVGIGDGDTPTPRGDFYIAELLRSPSPDGLYGPFAFGLSGFSDVIDTFRGGPAIIGLHGTNRPDRLGTRVSLGCVRVRNSVIEELAAMIPLGTPVRIT